MNMKKNYIRIIAAAASVLLFACCQQNEIDFGDKNGVVGENSIGFSLRGVDTRSAAVSSYEFAESGALIPFESEEAGTQFYLEESVIDLNAPVTRGTPVYTENVGIMYPQMYAHSVLDNVVKNGNIYTYDSETGYYIKSYGTNIWDVQGVETVTVGEETTKQIKFWMHMPTELTAYGVTSGPTFSETNSEQTISFSYESKAKATDQADIIFSARAVTEKEYNTNNRKVADVLFHHALTGVKFAIGNVPNDNITITKITFQGLRDKGSCVVTPRQETDGYVDDPTEDYSSGDGSTVVWTLQQSTKDIYAEFAEGDLTTFAQPEEGKNGSFTSKGEYPASFAQKGNANNLNDGDATKTFWLIPQTLNKNVKLVIEYKLNGTNASPITIDFGEALNNLDWEAGQLRTYTIRVADVNVKIEDEVTMSENYVSTNFLTAVGSKKENVVITNTGNTPAYIRAAIVGQWIDASGKPVFAFTEFKNGQIDIHPVPSWYQDQFGSSNVSPAYEFGYFSKLVGYDASGKYKDAAAYKGTHWTKGADGYYYYDDPVPVGGTTAEPLFESYTIASVPNIRIAGASQEVTFVLEVATQAISANNSDGTQWASATAAWNNAKQQQ